MWKKQITDKIFWTFPKSQLLEMKFTVGAEVIMLKSILVYHCLAMCPFG